MRTPFKRLSLGMLTILASAMTIHAQSGMIVHDLSTGVTNGSSSLISYGSSDDTWKVKLAPARNSQPSLTAYVCSNLNGT